MIPTRTSRPRRRLHRPCSAPRAVACSLSDRSSTKSAWDLPKSTDSKLPESITAQRNSVRATLRRALVGQRALPKADVVPGIVFVAGLEKVTDPGEPVPLMQPDAAIVGQRDHRYGAVEALAAQPVE
jgi:hypothetical protein